MVGRQAECASDRNKNGAMMRLHGSRSRRAGISVVMVLVPAPNVGRVSFCAQAKWNLSAWRGDF
jgi:hypothetical protein